MTQLHELEGEALDRAVAHAMFGDSSEKEPTVPWSSSWTLGGMVIAEHGICLTCYDRKQTPRAWRAVIYPGLLADFSRSFMAYGPTALVAAMRAYVLAQAGEQGAAR